MNEEDNNYGDNIFEEIKILKEECERTNCRFMDLDQHSIDLDLVALIPKIVIKKFKILPVKTREQVLVLAMVNPLNVFAIDDIKMMTGKEIEPVVVLERQLVYYQKIIYRLVPDLDRCKEEALHVKALAKNLGIPFYYLYPELFKTDAVSMIPAEAAREFNLIPIAKIGNKLRVAMADCRDVLAISALEKMTGCKVEYIQALPDQIKDYLDVLYGPESSSSNAG